MKSNRDLSQLVHSAAALEEESSVADCTSFEVDLIRWERFTESLDRPPRIPSGLEELFSRPSVFN
jgi:uncharacterized protein (DUF1778 family)